MEDVVVRLSKISMQDFKNVKNGELDFHNRRKNYQASILGLYGQNGSGKTALIDALQLLKHILCGQSAPADMSDYINVDAERAVLSYTFDIAVPFGKFEAFYELNIRKEADILEQNLGLPVTKYEHLIGKDKGQAMELLVAKKIASQTALPLAFKYEGADLEGTGQMTLPLEGHKIELVSRTERGGL